MFLELNLNSAVIQNKAKLNHQINIKQILEERGVSIKFAGCVPEGFVLVHEKTLEDLRDFDIWKNWKNNEVSIESLNQLNFKDEKNLSEETKDSQSN